MGTPVAVTGGTVAVTTFQSTGAAIVPFAAAPLVPSGVTFGTVPSTFSVAPTMTFGTPTMNFGSGAGFGGGNCGGGSGSDAIVAAIDRLIAAIDKLADSDSTETSSDKVYDPATGELITRAEFEKRYGQKVPAAVPPVITVPKPRTGPSGVRPGTKKPRTALATPCTLELSVNERVRQNHERSVADYNRSVASQEAFDREMAEIDAKMAALAKKKSAREPIVRAESKADPAR